MLSCCVPRHALPAILLVVLSGTAPLNHAGAAEDPAERAKPFATVEEAKAEFARLEKVCTGELVKEKFADIEEACNTWMTRFAPDGAEKYTLSQTGVARTYGSLSYIHYRQGDHDKALSEAEEALKRKQDLYLPHFVKGAVAASRGKNEDALQSLTVSIKLFDWVRARLERGKVYYDLSNYEASLADLDAVIPVASDEVLLEAREARAQTNKMAKKLDDALADYAELAKLDPKNSKWDIEWGEIQLEQGNDRQALEAANRALSIEPQKGSALKLRYKVYAESKDPDIRDIDKAIDDLKIVLDKAEKKATIEDAFLGMLGGSYDDLAKLYAEKKSYGEAIAAMDRQVASSKDAGVYLVHRSQYHQLNGDLPKALADAEKALELYVQKDGPDGTFNGSAHRRLAEVYIAQGDIAKGLNYFASKWSRFEEAMNIGWARSVLPEATTKEQAQEQAKLILDMKAQLPPANDKTKKAADGATLDCSRGQILAKFDPDEALKVFATLHETMDFCSYNGEALIHARTRNLSGQLAAYNGYIARNPENTNFIEKRGYVHLAMGNLDKALDDARLLMKLKPRNGSGPALEARVYEAKRDYTKELARGEDMIKTYPKWGMGHNIVARSLLKLGKPDLSLAAATRALALPDNGNNPEFLHTQARAYQAKGQPDDAWLGYLKAIGQDGTEELVTAFQYALKEQGLYQGAVDAQKSPDLEKAIEACVRKPDCSLEASR